MCSIHKDLPCGSPTLADDQASGPEAKASRVIS